jgi:hypothetical protein
MTMLAHCAMQSLPYVLWSVPHTGAFVVGMSVQSHSAQHAHVGELMHCVSVEHALWFAYDFKVCTPHSLIAFAEGSQH